ncbi:hypothetical protein BASA81_006157 [Batrachochytrium salamandrivorans]|nr:hypothetical protein BASA81_006157 [Batrachochytrium salamandrivorans]
MSAFWGAVNDTQRETNASNFIRTKTRLAEREDKLASQIQHLQSMLQDRPCAWVPDEDRSKCFGCSSKFTLFNRRHHCRACGEVFDSSCAGNFKPLPTYPKAGPQRVCDLCFTAKAKRVVDFAAMAGLLSGQPGATLVEEDEQDSLCENDFIVEVRVQSVRGEEVVPPMAKHKSEIPIPPPLPLVIPNHHHRPAIILPTNLALKKTLPASATTATAPTKMELMDIQHGLRSLRKVAPLTPAQRKEQANANCSDFQLSLRKRRMAMEDSAVLETSCILLGGSSPVKKSRTSLAAAPNHSTPAAVSRHLLESLIHSVKHVEHDTSNQNMSVNSSFAFH